MAKTRFPHAGMRSSRKIVSGFSSDAGSNPPPRLLTDGSVSILIDASINVKAGRAYLGSAPSSGRESRKEAGRRPPPGLPQ